MRPRAFILVSLLLPVLVAASAPTAGGQKKEPAKALTGYATLVVEKFAVEKNAATEDLPKGLEMLMQGRVVQKLREKKFFEEVIDGSEAAPGDAGSAKAQSEKAAAGASTNPIAKKAASDPSPTPAPSDAAANAPPQATAAKAQADSGGVKPTEPDKGRRLILSGTVLMFDKGSRAARSLVGFGAGQARMKVRFVFRDAKTGAEVLRLDQQSTFKGTFSAFGGSEEEGFTTAARGVVNKLINEIEKNR